MVYLADKEAGIFPLHIQSELVSRSTLLGAESGSEKQNFQKIPIWERFLYNIYFYIF